MGRDSPRSPSANEGDDLDFVSSFESSVILLAPEQSSVQLDRDLFGSEVVPSHQGADGLSFRKISGFAVHSNGHKGITLGSVGREALLLVFLELVVEGSPADAQLQGGGSSVAVIAAEGR